MRVPNGVDVLCRTVDSTTQSQGQPHLIVDNPSLLYKSKCIKVQQKSESQDQPTHLPLTVDTGTRVVVLYEEYRVTISLDVSPSMTNIDCASGKTHTDTHNVLHTKHTV